MSLRDDAISEVAMLLRAPKKKNRTAEAIVDRVHDILIGPREIGCDCRCHKGTEGCAR